MKVLLFDIEGTTTDINFVHKVLFPYSYDRMESFILHNQRHPEVIKALTETYNVIVKEQNTQMGLYDLIHYLKFWIKTDRKIAPLKTLQGLIWDEGYSKGDFKGHIYPEVATLFETWTKSGMKLAIYSSGSVHAQKMIFKNSIDGDLTVYLSEYFDTAVGGKRESSSYEKIAQCLKVSTTDITFFSDITEELVAAQKARLNVVHVVRPGTKSSHEFQKITNFSEFSV